MTQVDWTSVEPLPKRFGKSEAMARAARGLSHVAWHPPKPPQEAAMYRLKRKRALYPASRLTAHDAACPYLIIHNETGKIMTEMAGRDKARALCRQMNSAADAHRGRS